MKGQLFGTENAFGSNGAQCLMRAQGGVGEVDAQGAGGEAAELFEGELVAGQGVDPAAQAAAALVGEREQALGRACPIRR